MTKFLVVHNILWAHYKAAVHSRFFELSEQNDIDFHVIHMAKTRNRRKNIGSIDLDKHRYPYTVLIDGFLEESNAIGRSIKLWKAIQKIQPDIIFMSYSDLAYLPIIFWLKFSKTKFFLAFDSNWEDKKRYSIIEFFKSKMMRFPDLIFSYGILQQDYLRRLKAPESKMRLRVQGTDSDAVVHLYNQAKKANKDWGFPKRNFLYAGRFAKIKNVDFLIDVFKNLKEHDWGLIVIGSGPDEDELLAQSEGIENIYFTGGKTWEEVIELYTQASVLVLPSTSEPWGIVVNEAMWCGIPVLVSDQCGCSKDMVDGKNGFLFDPYDKSDLAKRMEWFLDNPDKLESMGEHSRKIVDTHSYKFSAEQIMKEVKKN